MTYIRRLILALALSAGLAPAFAQVPPPVPALPDTERRTTYSISSSICICAVNFALYGDSTDYTNWLEVWVNGTRLAQAGNWTISSPSGSFATLPRPITDAVLTFAVAQTGTVQIVGARRPRRTSQFNEGAGVPTRNINQVVTDITATLRELWDKTNDVTGRAALAPPGETLSVLPAAASRKSQGVCFDSNGNFAPCVSIPTSTFVAGSGVIFTGTNPTTISTPTAATYAAGAGILFSGSNPTTISASTAANNINSQAGNYTIQTSDCGKTVQETGGPWVITLPAAIGFPSGCVVSVNNGNAVRAHKLTGFPAYSLNFLYSGQTEVVTTVNGLWTVTGAPGRFKLTGSTTIFVNSSTGSDVNNDGLAVGSPKATVQAALYQVSNDFDFLTSVPSIPIVTILQGANDTAGVHFGPQGLSGAAAGGSITWDGGGFSVSNVGDTDDAIHLFFGTAIYLQNMTIVAGAANHQGLNLEHGANAFIKSGVVFTGTTQFTNHIAVRDGASIEIDNNYSISGPAFSHAFCTNGGTIRGAVPITATVTTPITVNTTILATVGGICDFSNVTFAGSAVTGTRFQAINAIIQSKSGTPQVSIPGTVNGTATNAGSADTVMSTTVPQGGTGVASLTAHGILIGEGTGAIAAAAAMTDGQILMGQTGADPIANPNCAFNSTFAGLNCTSAVSQLPTIQYINTTADNLGASLQIQKSRTGAAINNNDFLGFISWWGFANGAYQQSATMSVTSEGTITGSNIPTKWQIATSNAAGHNNQSLSFNSAAHFSSGQATAPTITAGCTGAGSAITGTDMAGTVTGSTAAVTTCTITFGTAYGAAPNCGITGLSSPLTGAITVAAGTIAVNFASTANYKWSYVCMGT